MPPLIPKTYNLKPNLRRLHFCLAAAFILFGLISLLPINFLRPHHLLFGLFGTAPILSLLFILFGLSLAGSLYLAAQVNVSLPHRRLSQAIGCVFAVLTIIGFLSTDYWLNLFPNTLASNSLYSLIAVYFLYLGFFHQVPSPQTSSLSQAVGGSGVGKDRLHVYSSTRKTV